MPRVNARFLKLFARRPLARAPQSKFCFFALTRLIGRMGPGEVELNSHRFLLQLLSLVVGGQTLDDLIEGAFHHEI